MKTVTRPKQFVWAFSSGSAAGAVAVIAAAVAAIALTLFTMIWKVHLVTPGGRAAVETAISLMTLLASALLALRIRRSPRAHDVLLLSALIAVGLTDFVFSALPDLAGIDAVPFGVDARLAAQALVPIAFAVAAFANGAPAAAGRRWRLVLTASACLAVVAVAEVLDLMIGRHGGLGRVDPALSGILGGLEALTFVIAGVVFAWRSPAESDRGELIATAAFLLAGARLQTVVMPSIAANWLTPRDLLRFAAYGLLLAAVVREYVLTNRVGAHDAVQAERERIARDIHDGLAQDLATIAIHSQHLEDTLGVDHPVTVAARRALAASRDTIVDLSASRASDTSAALREVAGELEARFGIWVTVTDDLDGASAIRDLTAMAREQTVRIAREAIVNAARHGGAQHVDVLLKQRGRRWLLSVSDDGSGIEQAALTSSSGYGLRTMRARADELGGQLTARRGASGGTVLELSMAEGTRR